MYVIRGAKAVASSNLKCGLPNFLNNRLHDLLSIDGIPHFIRVAVSIHRFKPAIEHRALLDFIPIMEHVAILNRTSNLLLTTRDHLTFELLDCLLQCLFGVAPVLHRFQQVCNVADAMVETLTSI